MTWLDGCNFFSAPISPTLLIWICCSFRVFLAQSGPGTQTDNMFLLILVSLMVHIRTGATLNCAEEVNMDQIQNMTFLGGFLAPVVNISWGQKELGNLSYCVSELIKYKYFYLKLTPLPLGDWSLSESYPVDGEPTPCPSMIRLLLLKYICELCSKLLLGG